MNDCSLEFLHTICLPRGLCHCPTLHGRVRSNECWPEGSKATNACPTLHGRVRSNECWPEGSKATYSCPTLHGRVCNGRHVDTHWMTEWWPRIKGRKRWGGCDEVVLGDERARRGARSCWRGPSDLRSTMAGARSAMCGWTGSSLDWGKRGVGLWKAAAKTSPKVWRMSDEG